MRRTTQSSTIALLLLLSANIIMANAQGLTLQVQINKPVFRPGDTIVVTAVVTNTKSEIANIALEATLQDLMGKYPASPFRYPQKLNQGETKTIELFNVIIDDTFYSGQYIVHVSLIEGGFRIDEKEIRFSIVGAPEDMQIRLLLCKDPSYTESARIFIKGEKIYIGSKCSAANPSITADLTLPDNSTKRLTLPTSIIGKLAGLYTIQLRASAKGYRNVTLTEYFAVLEKEISVIPIEKKPSSLTLSVQKNEINEGETIEVRGTLTPIHADSGIALTYQKDGKDVQKKTATTDDEGRFTDTYKPEGSGEWGVTASWTGDSNHNSATSQAAKFRVIAPFPLMLVVGIAAVAVIGVGAILITRRRPKATT